MDNDNNLWVVGQTHSNLDGSNLVGGSAGDAWVCKFTPNVQGTGLNLQWVKQLRPTAGGGTWSSSSGHTPVGSDNLCDIVVDSNCDYVFLSGSTKVQNEGIKYDNRGRETRIHLGWVVILDATNGDYVTDDVILNGYSSSRNSYLYSLKLSPSEEYLYVVGYEGWWLATYNLGTGTPTLSNSSYIITGTPVTSHQGDNPFTVVVDPATTSTNSIIYVSGKTVRVQDGILTYNDDLGDALLIKYTGSSPTSSHSNDFLLQLQSTGTSTNPRYLDRITDMILVEENGTNYLYVCGFTAADIAGTSAGGLDAFIGKYATDGTEQWLYQFGENSGSTNTIN